MYLMKHMLEVISVFLCLLVNDEKINKRRTQKAAHINENIFDTAIAVWYKVLNRFIHGWR